MESQSLAWGIGFAAMMYILGNGIWTNHLARKNIWMGWLMWLGAGMVVILAGAVIDIRLSGSSMGLWEQLSSVDIENHWIAFMLFALMSVPGAASVILKLEAIWTRLALILPAIVVFVPVGMQLGAGMSSVAAGLGLALAVSSMMFAWQSMLDTPPEEVLRKTA